MKYADVRQAKAELGEAREEREGLARIEDEAKRVYFAKRRAARFAGRESPEFEAREAAGEALQAAKVREEAARLAYNAILQHFERRRFADALEDLAADERLDGVPVEFQKFQKPLKAAMEAHGLRCTISGLSIYEAVEPKAVDADEEREAYNGEVYRPTLDGEHWAGSGLASFCDEEGGRWRGRPVFDCKRAEEHAAALRANNGQNPTAAQIKRLAGRYREELDALQAKAADQANKLNAKAAKFDVLGPGASFSFKTTRE